MRLLLSPALRAAEPRLNGLDRLVTRWMNGIMFYLDEDVPLVAGHAIYIDSPWALTSISQAQFWRDVDFARLGDGRVAGILSVDVSDWETPAPRLGKVASACTKEEIADEVWAQLKDHLDRGELSDANRLRWFLDPDIVFPNPSGATNAEPLLINTAGSWEHRPDAVTAIGNLLLAADYVRTYTDLATMEGANEAARRAVNGILDAEGSDAPALRGVAAAGAGRLQAGAVAGPPALAPAAPAQAAAAGGGGGPPRAHRACQRGVTTTLAGRPRPRRRSIAPALTAGTNPTQIEPPHSPRRVCQAGEAMLASSPAAAASKRLASP